MEPFCDKTSGPVSDDNRNDLDSPTGKTDPRPFDLAHHRLLKSGSEIPDRSKMTPILVAEREEVEDIRKGPDSETSEGLCPFRPNPIEGLYWYGQVWGKGR